MQKAPIISLLAICGLAATTTACERKTEPAAAAKPEVAATPPVDATSLWLIEVVDGGKAASQLHICADKSIQASFVRPAPEVNGQPCVRVGEAVETGDTYSVRCRIDDQLYRVGSSVDGDREKDFKVDMAVTRQDKKGPNFEQVRHYQRLGACPTGWVIGDSAAPGAAKIVNTLTGATRDAAAPAP